MIVFAGWLQTFLLWMLSILQLLILVRAILSWFPISTENRLVRVLYDLTEPVLVPFRRVIPRIGMFDLSLLAALLVLQLLESGVRTGSFF